MSSHRFVTPEIARKYDLEVPAYEGVDQIVELDAEEKEKP
jgi:NAD(P)H-hydrate epimerase